MNRKKVIKENFHTEDGISLGIGAGAVFGRILVTLGDAIRKFDENTKKCVDLMKTFLDWCLSVWFWSSLGRWRRIQVYDERERLVITYGFLWLRFRFRIINVSSSWTSSGHGFDVLPISIM